MRSVLTGITLCCCFFIACNSRNQARPNEHVRLSRLVIKESQLINYKLALKKHIEDAKNNAAGIKTLYPVFEAGTPNRVTMLEVYLSREDYLYYLKSAHYSKYKEATRDMIENIELLEATSLMPLEN